MAAACWATATMGRKRQLVDDGGGDSLRRRCVAAGAKWSRTAANTTVHRPSTAAPSTTRRRTSTAAPAAESTRHRRTSIAAESTAPPPHQHRATAAPEPHQHRATAGKVQIYSVPLGQVIDGRIVGVHGCAVLWCLPATQPRPPFALAERCQ
nr:hypothetical protein Iba_chr05bCG9620 [Ipomoea batatas]